MSYLPEPSGAYLREVLATDYTDEQLAIVTAALAPQLVVAGAGSGKTSVMAARVVHLVAFHRVPPGAVLGLTFTNKAANELALKVRMALTALGLADRTAAVAGSSSPVVAGGVLDDGLPDGALPDDALPDDGIDDEPTVSTYHAYAARLVADHALRIGREPLTTLLTEAARWQLAMRVVRAAEGPLDALELTPAFVARYLLLLDAEMAEHLVAPDEVRACDAGIVDAAAAVPKPTAKLVEAAGAASKRDDLLGLVERYRERKLALDLLDYGDQVAVAAEIAQRRPDVGRLERERFAVVVLDEYQDTGVAQRVLLAALYGQGHPVTAVGDPCQSIYGWRGASVGNLLRFPEHFRGPEAPGCEPQYLLTSFRSGGRLLDLANAISAPLGRPRPGSRRPHVEVPVLRPAPGRGRDGEVRCSLHRTSLDEAGWVADQVAEAVLVDGFPAQEVAVLCRRRADFAAVHEELVRRGLPVEVVGLGGLLDVPEVADVVATLDVLAEPTANAALMRILTGPRWRIGPRDLAALGGRAAALAARSRTGTAQSGREDADPHGVAPGPDSDGRRALEDATAAVDPCDVVALTDALDSPGPATAYSPEAVERFAALAGELQALRRLVSQPVVEIVAEVVVALGLDIEIEAQRPQTATARSANLAAFLDHAARFVGIDGEADLGAFVAFLAAARDAESGLDIGGVSESETVKLLTVHKAKGLEWSVVAVPGVSDGVFPSRQGRSKWTGSGAVLPFRLRGDCDDLPADPDWTSKGLQAFLDACREDERDEERRLAYVAVTRARTRLLVSGHHWAPGLSGARDRSPFLAEVQQACVAGAGTVGPWLEEPGDNPLVDVDVDVAWPVPYEPVPRALRAAAAAAVLAALEDAEAQGAVRAAHPATGWDREADLLVSELAEAGAGDVPVALPRSLTASQVVRLGEDPDDLARALARPMPRRPSEAARRGTRFHAWVEQLFDQSPLIDSGDLPGGGDADIPSDDELAALQEAFSRSPYGGVRPYAVEAPFELVVAGRLVRGRIDAVYRTAEGYDVIDYKTGSLPRDPHTASLQLAVYRLAWAGIVGVPVRDVGAGFLYVRTGELRRPPDLLDEAGLARLLTGE